LGVEMNRPDLLSVGEEKSGSRPKQPVARTLLVLFPIVTLLLFSPRSMRAQCTLSSPTTWNISGDGNWSTNGDWNPAFFPNSTSTNVCIANGTSTVTLDTNASVANLQLSSGNTLTTNPGTQLVVAGGQILNAGQILVNSGGGLDSFLTLGADTTLQGGGTVTLANVGGGGTSFLDGTHVLTNVDNTIQGAGTIGDSTFGFPLLINEAAGTINANTSGQELLIDGVFLNNAGQMKATGGGGLDFTEGILVNGGAVVSDGSGSLLQLNASTVSGGTITASNGGQLGINGGTTVTGATITALSGGTVSLSAADIIGGTLNNAGGTIQAGSGGFGATLDGSTGAGAVTIQGTYTTLSGGETTLLGTINNQGNMQFGSSSELILRADTTLQGGGSVTLANSGLGGTHVLTNVDNTIQGWGVIGGTGLGFPLIINEAGGTINANTSGQELLIDGVFLNNAGLMEATNGGVLNLNGSPLTNGGTVIVDAVSGLLTNAAFTQAGGKTQVDGFLIASEGVNVSGGSMLGHGTIFGNVTMTGGVMQPGDVTVPGTLTINGDFSHSTALFDELISASGNGLLVVNGVATLGPDSLLNIDLLGGFTPFDGETFTIMDFSSGSGEFANAPPAGFVMDGFDWTISYNANSIVLDAVSPVSGVPTPEPSTTTLLSASIFALLGYALLRQRAKAARE
jgi:hypothetical protein